MYTIITENDISKWADKTGELYHFPARYLSFLKPDTQIVYYKGRMTDKRFLKSRLSTEPHYFGTGIIGEVYPDKASKKKDYFASIKNFQRYSQGVPFKINGVPIEEIPESRRTNYWRDGVRPISEAVFNRIMSFAGLEGENILADNFQGQEEALISHQEGNKKQVYTTVYERNPKLRSQAIRIHGLSCMACGLNFKDTYGDWGTGYVHVHHVKPVSEAGVREVNAETDLVVLCANCHAMVHRKWHQTLSLEDLIAIIHNQ